MNDISITRKEFDLLFPGKEHVWHLLTTKPKTEQELLFKYLPSKLWRLNNIYKIIDKYGEPCTFRMNRAQFRVYSHKFLHWRLIILKSRQQGISTLYLIDYFDDTLFMPNLSCGLMAQDKEAATTLLERVKYTWDEFNPDFKSFLGRTLIKNNASEFSFNNNSQMLIRTSFRSGTLQRLHISELGKIANKYPEKAKETKTGTLQAIAPGNHVGIESTAEGSNMFKTDWDNAAKRKILGLPTDRHEELPSFQRLWSPEHMRNNTMKLADKDFYPVFLSWLYDPDCVEFEEQYIIQDHKEYFETLKETTGITITTPQKNFWITQERELPSLIHQEYPATPEEAFAASKDGTYWSKLYLNYIIRKNQKRANLYDPNLPVFCVQDLGRGDYNVLLFFQFWKAHNGRPQIRIIHTFKDCGKGIDYYADYIQAKGQFHNAPTKDWDIEIVALPHDGVVTDISTKGDKTREDIYNEEGVTNTMILDKWDRTTSIDLVRQAMEYIWIDNSCDYICECFLNYTKQWDKLLEIWKKEPKPGEFNHGADAVRYMIQYVDQYIWQITRQKEKMIENRSTGKSLKPVGKISL